jgi:hypothetical protein
MYQKNVAVTGYTFGLRDATTGAPVSVGSPTGYLAKDGSTQTLMVNPITSLGNGQWRVNITSSEMNADVVAIAVVLAGADTWFDTIKTVAFDPNNTVNLGLSAIPPAPHTSLGGLPTCGILDFQLNLDDGQADISQVGANRVWLSSSRTLTDKTGFSLSSSQTFNLTGNITGNISGSVGSVTGSVGSVTGSVGSIAAGGITAASIASNAITSAKIAAGAITSTTFATGAITSNVLANDSIGAAVFSQGAADKVWATGTRSLTDKSGFNLASSQTFNLTGNITGNLSGSVGSVAGTIGSLPPSERNFIAEAVMSLTDGVEAGYTLRRSMRLIGAAVAGRISGAETSSVIIRNMGNTTDQILANVDTDGNRLTVSHGA